MKDRRASQTLASSQYAPGCRPRSRPSLLIQSTWPSPYFPIHHLCCAGAVAFTSFDLQVAKFISSARNRCLGTACASPPRSPDLHMRIAIAAVSGPHSVKAIITRQGLGRCRFLPTWVFKSRRDRHRSAATAHAPDAPIECTSARRSTSFAFPRSGGSAIHRALRNCAPLRCLLLQVFFHCLVEACLDVWILH